MISEATEPPRWVWSSAKPPSVTRPPSPSGTGRAQGRPLRSRSGACVIVSPMKVGIVVPFSWSFFGGVVDHAESQAAALRTLGIETRIVIGNDPPGSFTRFLHPRSGRHGSPPPEVIPVGRSVIVPANGSLPNIVLSPSAVYRLRRLFLSEPFDVVHLHEPMTPAICVAALTWARCPVVATWHAAGDIGWMKLGLPAWGFLLDRI